MLDSPPKCMLCDVLTEGDFVRHFQEVAKVLWRSYHCDGLIAVLRAVNCRLARGYGVLSPIHPTAEALHQILYRAVLDPIPHDGVTTVLG